MLYEWSPEDIEIEIEKDGKLVKETIKTEFEGKVSIEVPKYVQRMKYLKECNFKIGEGSQVQMGMESMDSIVKMIELAPKHVKNVSLSHMKSGDKFKKWEDLEEDYRCDQILNQIASVIVNGPQLGKD